ncbi:MAG TPA: glycosyltransferase [Acidisarcina sp.]
MSRKLRIAYFAHSLRSDWNNGNAHFLRGLMRALTQLGHEVIVYEPETEWSVTNLRQEALGERSLQQFANFYPDLSVITYNRACSSPEQCFSHLLRGTDIVILHEWNPPHLAQTLLGLREQLGYKLLFHDTHHRASSSPEQMRSFGLHSFDGVVAFGAVLAKIYREGLQIKRVWTLHEAADTSIFKPFVDIPRENGIVWIGNWGEGERATEIGQFLLQPVKALRDLALTTIYGVRYPIEALDGLREAEARYGGYLPNLDAPRLYASAAMTVHIPRQQYTQAMKGIPTIRVFEALACGVPVVSAPWQDIEGLFRPGDFQFAANSTEMTAAMRCLLLDRTAAEDQAARGLESILSRHTCAHRAAELTAICEEVLA